jgi:hypothetical protein
MKGSVDDLGDSESTSLAAAGAKTAGVIHAGNRPPVDGAAIRRGFDLQKEN